MEDEKNRRRSLCGDEEGPVKAAPSSAPLSSVESTTALPETPDPSAHSIAHVPPPPTTTNVSNNTLASHASSSSSLEASGDLLAPPPSTSQNASSSSSDSVVALETQTTNFFTCEYYSQQQDLCFYPRSCSDCLNAAIPTQVGRCALGAVDILEPQLSSSPLSYLVCCGVWVL